jgi:hypothetical protein
MTKFAKISLVAAVAVAGLTTANAQPLEEAIKGVDVSGMMRYRFESVEKGAVKKNQNDYRIDLKTTAAVNDMVKANVLVGTVYTEGMSTSSIPTSTGASISTESADINAGLEVREANFAINAMGATILAGKQSIPGPFVDNTVDNTARGSGVVALMPVGGLTLAAGTFNNTTLAGGADASEFAVIGNIGGVAADLWYINAVTPTEITGYSAHANGNIGSVNVDARYTVVDHRIANNDEASLLKVIASTKIGDVSVAAGYINTGKNNSPSNYVSFDNDAATDAKVWQASAGNLDDADAYLVSVGTAVAGVSLKATYLNVNFGTANTGADEKLLDVGYNLSKNFALAGKYSIYSVDGAADSTKTRIEAKYTF